MGEREKRGETDRDRGERLKETMSLRGNWGMGDEALRRRTGAQFCRASGGG